MKSKKYYAYFLFSGERGICGSWGECEKLVKGVKDARFQSFKTKEEAEKWLQEGAVYKLKVKRILEAGIYFDAGTGRGNGVEISVTDKNGKDLLDKVLLKKKLNKYHKHLVKGVSNNYGELLACNYALQLAMKSNFKKVYPEQSRRVFGDSKLVVNFWSKGFFKKNKLNKKTIDLISEVSELRRRFENGGGEMFRISGADNPADLGFHR